MRTLVVGVGGIGGYFGGRLAESGRDVTFLVRPRRAAQLAKTGLVIKSPLGDYHNPSPKLVTTQTLDGPYDLILLSCKAYDLADAMDSFAAAVGPNSMILPLLNGMDHLNALDARFGADRVFGGLCQISVALDAEGRILHFNKIHNLVFGDRADSLSQRAESFAPDVMGAGFNARMSAAIDQEMWEKWVFIATCAGITCLMRSAIGDVIKAGGGATILSLFDECAAIAARQGHAPGEPFLSQSRKMLADETSTLMASMLRDVENGNRTEGDHILAALLRRDSMPDASPLLGVASLHLKAYEQRRLRETQA